MSEVFILVNLIIFLRLRVQILFPLSLSFAKLQSNLYFNVLDVDFAISLVIL